MRSVVQWLLGRSSLYLLLVLAVAFVPLVQHTLFRGNLRSELLSPSATLQQFQQLRGDALEGFKKKQAEVGTYSSSAVTKRLSQAQAELMVVTNQLEAKPGWFASIRPRAILEKRQLELRQAGLQGEIRLLQNARDRHSIANELQSVRTPTPVSVVAAKRSCEAANAEVRRFNSRYALEKSVRNVLLDEARQLTDQAQKRCAEYQARVDLQNAARERVRRLQANFVEAQGTYARAGGEALDSISRVRMNLSGTVQSVMLSAAVLLAGIIATPYLIRLLFYFILAPLAERRPAVRLRLPSGSMLASATLLQASAVSAPIKLEAGSELLVRQGFLQSTSSIGAKATRALLDWHHPLSSLASGLAFLTRIQGVGETTTVSAVNDPFAEVAVLNLPPGSACVLQPRALVAIVQPIGQPMRISSHWRIGSLHAWLTLQLRYLMFHGPARLVIKGGRGVRVEQVQRGRVFGQAQLVGFSADLAYSVTRAETFWPYFVGIESLLKDKVEAGQGVVVIEEAPMTADGRAPRSKGLEGAFDVLLKTVGL